MRYVLFILMAIALVSCASPRIESLPDQKVVAPVETTEPAETALEPVVEGIEDFMAEDSIAEDSIAEEPPMPVIAINPELQKEEEISPVENFVAEPVLVPITKHFVINQQDIYVSAYVGEATVSYPENWDNAVVDEVIAYLANKYPVETKDIIFTHENNTLTFSYPMSWSEAEFNYALELLGNELSNIEQPKAELSWEVIRIVRILDKEEPETNGTIVYEPAEEEVVLEEETAEVVTEEPDYITNWMEDPIYIGAEILEAEAEAEAETEEVEPTAEASPIVIYEDVVTEIQKASEALEEEPEETAEVVETVSEAPEAEAPEENNENQNKETKAWRKTVEPYLETINTVAAISIAVLFFLILLLAIKKREKK